MKALSTIAPAGAGGCGPAWPRQRGASLFFALTALVGLTAAGVAMMRTADTSTLVAGNIGFHASVVQASDLALEAAITTTVALASAGTDTVTNTGQGYYASLDSTAPSATMPPAARLSDSNGISLADSGSGNTLRYVIERLCNATGAPTATGCAMDGAAPIYRVTTLATGPRNTSEIVQSQIVVSVFMPDCALMTRGSITISGTSKFDGVNRCIFANGNIDMAGTPVSGFIGNVASSGSIAGAAKITGAGGTVSPSQPAKTFPTFNTNDYRQYADYIFRSNGQILRTSDNTVVKTATSSGSAWQGWYRESSSPVRWRKGDSSVSQAGLYYFEGNVAVSGSVSGAWNVSFIAEGAIQISGECYFVNYTGNAAAPQAVNNILMMARGDIELNGNSSAPAMSGLIITNEELKFNGNNRIVGNLIALNANNTDPSGLDNFIDFNEFSGDTTLTYAPDMANNLWQPLTKRVLWRTVAM